MRYTLYGIKNCDTVRRARQWLNSRAVPYTYRDLRIDGLDAMELKRWIAAVGWETLLNRRSTSWRELSETERSDIDQARAIALMLAEPTLIKRPVLVCGGEVYVGFSEANYAKICDN